MKSKSIKQINRQASGLLCDIVNSNHPRDIKVKWMKRVNEISDRYRTNALEWLCARLSPAELEEYGMITGVPSGIYAE